MPIIQAVQTDTESNIFTAVSTNKKFAYTQTCANQRSINIPTTTMHILPFDDVILT